MKLLTVSHLYPNPAEPIKGVFVAELVAALSRKIESRVLAPVSWFPVVRPAKEIPLRDESTRSLVEHPRYLALPKWLFEWRWRTFHRTVAKAIDGEGDPFLPDIVHAHWLYPDGFAADRWAKGHGYSTVVTIHGHASLGLGILGRPSPRHREALHSIDRIIAVSRELENLLVTRFDVPPEKIRVIHNGVDSAKFPPTPREDARRRLGLALNRRIVICVARLSPEKQIDLLIEAVSRSKTEGLQVFIIGEGPQSEHFNRLIAAGNLQNKVILTGGIRHERLGDWYCAADLFCLTSAHEGCPVVISEALACGLPVVATPVGSIPDIIQPGKTGLIAHPEAGSIAGTIDEALKRTWDLRAIEEEGRRQTWDAVADRTIEVYRELMELCD